MTGDEPYYTVINKPFSEYLQYASSGRLISLMHF